MQVFCGLSLGECVSLSETIRVLVVDDSAFMRRMISRVFEQDASVQVVGQACDGTEALAKIDELRPHVVTLDIEMPEMDGMETLRQIMARHHGVRVIMVSSLTERGAQVTIEALLKGASDYVTKPLPSAGDAWAHLSAELLFKVKQFFSGEPKAPRDAAAAGYSGLRTARASVPRGPAPEICAIGVSTGGPTALMDSLPMLPKHFPLPIVIVQHMPAEFTSMLAKRLDAACQINVEEGRDGMTLRAGSAVLAPGGFHMRVLRQHGQLVVKLDEGPKENSCRPAVDVIFRSIAEQMEGRAVAAVLTGMGYDGLAGARQLKALGATILAQDEATSVVWGMPGAVVAAKLADAVLPIREIAPELLRRVANT
jgi:two-component system chemotaxis response regulator CheB